MCVCRSFHCICGGQRLVDIRYLHLFLYLIYFFKGLSLILELATSARLMGQWACLHCQHWDHRHASLAWLSYGCQWFELGSFTFPRVISSVLSFSNENMINDCVYVCMCVCICLCGCPCVMVFSWRSWDNFRESQFSPFTMWVPGIKLGSPGLVTSPFICSAVLVTSFLSFIIYLLQWLIHITFLLIQLR